MGTRDSQSLFLRFPNELPRKPVSPRSGKSMQITREASSLLIGWLHPPTVPSISLGNTISPCTRSKAHGVGLSRRWITLLGSAPCLREWFLFQTLTTTHQRHPVSADSGRLPRCSKADRPVEATSLEKWPCPSWRLSQKSLTNLKGSFISLVSSYGLFKEKTLERKMFTQTRHFFLHSKSLPGERRAKIRN